MSSSSGSSSEEERQTERVLRLTEHSSDGADDSRAIRGEAGAGPKMGEGEGDGRLLLRGRAGGVLG